MPVPGGWYKTMTATLVSDTPKWRASLSFQAGTLQAAWVGARVMIGYRALAMDADAFGLGLVAAAFAVPAMITALPAGRMADRFGGMKLIAAGIGVQIVGIGGAAFTDQFGWLLMSAFLLGLGQIGCAVGLQSFVAVKAGPGSTDDAFGLLTAAVSVGQVIGPLVITAVATAGWRPGTPDPDTTLALSAAALMILLALGPCWLLMRSSPHHRKIPAPDQQRPNTRSIVRTPGLWRALLVSGIVLTAMDMLYAFLPAWAEENAVSVTAVGWLLALRAAVTVVSRIGLGKLVARLGRQILHADLADRRRRIPHRPAVRRRGRRDRCDDRAGHRPRPAPAAHHGLGRRQSSPVRPRRGPWPTAHLEPGHPDHRACRCQRRSRINGHRRHLLGQRHPARRFDRSRRHRR